MYLYVMYCGMSCVVFSHLFFSIITRALSKHQVIKVYSGAAIGLPGVVHCQGIINVFPSNIISSICNMKNKSQKTLSHYWCPEQWAVICLGRHHMGWRNVSYLWEQYHSALQLSLDLVSFQKQRWSWHTFDFILVQLCWDNIIPLLWTPSQGTSVILDLLRYRIHLFILLPSAICFPPYLSLILT